MEAHYVVCGCGCGPRARILRPVDYRRVLEERRRELQAELSEVEQDLAKLKDEGPTSA
jgi:sugar-specific transcriptional regulator TrmB